MKRLGASVASRLAHDGGQPSPISRGLDAIGYRRALRKLLDASAADRKPNEVFGLVDDDFWFWLNTAGYRRSAAVRSILPGLPDESVQLQFTGRKGDSGLREAFAAYQLFRDMYRTHGGPIDQADRVLDYGCGWGRTVRFFLKDLDPSKLWGADPVTEMIDICARHNRWCNFEVIDPHPPTPFPDGSFDMIYSYSVFSHLSEGMADACLAELIRVLKPGGVLMVTTRPRQFIGQCAELRRRTDLDSVHPGPRSSASAFLEPEQALADYDRGAYCFSPLAPPGPWDYWGEAAISQAYVLAHWTSRLTLRDYVDDRRRCPQNVVVLTKDP